MQYEPFSCHFPLHYENKYTLHYSMNHSVVRSLCTMQTNRIDNNKLRQRCLLQLANAATGCALFNPGDTVTVVRRRLGCTRSVGNYSVNARPQKALGVALIFDGVTATRNVHGVYSFVVLIDEGEVPTNMSFHRRRGESRRRGSCAHGPLWLY